MTSTAKKQEKKGKLNFLENYCVVKDSVSRRLIEDSSGRKLSPDSYGALYSPTAGYNSVRSVNSFPPYTPYLDLPIEESVFSCLFCRNTRRLSDDDIIVMPDYFVADPEALIACIRVGIRNALCGENMISNSYLVGRDTPFAVVCKRCVSAGSTYSEDSLKEKLLNSIEKMLELRGLIAQRDDLDALIVQMSINFHDLSRPAKFFESISLVTRNVFQLGISRENTYYEVACADYVLDQMCPFCLDLLNHCRERKRMLFTDDGIRLIRDPRKDSISRFARKTDEDLLMDIEVGWVAYDGSSSDRDDYSKELIRIAKEKFNFRDSVGLQLSGLPYIHGANCAPPYLILDRSVSRYPYVCSALSFHISSLVSVMYESGYDGPDFPSSFEVPSTVYLVPMTKSELVDLLKSRSKGC